MFIHKIKSSASQSQLVKQTVKMSKQSCFQLYVYAFKPTKYNEQELIITLENKLLLSIKTIILIDNYETKLSLNLKTCFIKEKNIIKS